MAFGFASWAKCLSARVERWMLSIMCTWRDHTVYSKAKLGGKYRSMSNYKKGIDHSFHKRTNPCKLTQTTSKDFGANSAELSSNLFWTTSDISQSNAMKTGEETAQRHGLHTICDMSHNESVCLLWAWRSLSPAFLISPWPSTIEAAQMAPHNSLHVFNVTVEISSGNHILSYLCLAISFWCSPIEQHALSAKSLTNCCFSVCPTWHLLQTVATQVRAVATQVRAVATQLLWLALLLLWALYLWSCLASALSANSAEQQKKLQSAKRAHHQLIPHHGSMKASLDLNHALIASLSRVPFEEKLDRDKHLSEKAQYWVLILHFWPKIHLLSDWNCCFWQHKPIKHKSIALFHCPSFWQERNQSVNTSYLIL